MEIGRPCRSCTVAEEVTIMGLYRWIPDVKNLCFGSAHRHIVH